MNVKEVVDLLLESSYLGPEEDSDEEVKCAEDLSSLSPEEKKMRIIKEQLFSSSYSLQQLVSSVEGKICQLRSFEFPPIGGESSVKSNLGRSISKLSTEFENIKSNSASLIMDWELQAKKIERELAEMQDGDGDLDTVSS